MGLELRATDRKSDSTDMLLYSRHTHSYLKSVYVCARITISRQTLTHTLTLPTDLLTQHTHTHTHTHTHLSRYTCEAPH